MKRNKFSLSHYQLLSMNQGAIVPIGHYEVLPGDTVQQSTSALVRAAPLVAPVMHPVHAKIHHWFVPYRLIWEDWEDFITGGPDGDNASVPPYIATSSFPANTVSPGSLADYLGIPTGTYANVLNVSALPFRAYALIYNEFYRDQDLVSPVVVQVNSNLDGTTSRVLLNSAWEKDSFTVARPFEQKGDAITVPIGIADPAQSGIVRATATGAPVVGALTSAAGGVFTSGATASYLDPNGNLSLSVSDLRESMALQRYAEARARYGSRYVEYLRYLGVKSSDARLQRPEYLGGGKQTIQFSEVLQTAEGTDPVGTMAGHGLGAMRSNRFRRFFEEHGIVMSFMIIKPRTIYMQAVARSFLRQTREDYWQRELEHIGQQEVTSTETYGLAGETGRGVVFGYQDRYNEYRRTESRVSGEFRTTLNYWHMARDLVAAPTLNASFITADPTTRIYAAPSAAQMYVMAMHSIQARRMVSASAASHIF